MFKYYMLHRWFGPGTYPKNGNLVDHGDYDYRTEVEPGVWAWSWLVYSKPLTGKEMFSYELKEASK